MGLYFGRKFAIENGFYRYDKIRFMLSTNKKRIKEYELLEWSSLARTRISDIGRLCIATEAMKNLFESLIDCSAKINYIQTTGQVLLEDKLGNKIGLIKVKYNALGNGKVAQSSDVSITGDVFLNSTYILSFNEPYALIKASEKGNLFSIVKILENGEEIPATLSKNYGRRSRPLNYERG